MKLRIYSYYEARSHIGNDLRVHLGLYETEEQAAKSFDECCIYQVGQGWQLTMALPMQTGMLNF